MLERPAQNFVQAANFSRTNPLEPHFQVRNTAQTAQDNSSKPTAVHSSSRPAADLDVRHRARTGTAMVSMFDVIWDYSAVDDADDAGSGIANVDDAGSTGSDGGDMIEVDDTSEDGPISFFCARAAGAAGDNDGAASTPARASGPTCGDGIQVIEVDGTSEDVALALVDAAPSLSPAAPAALVPKKTKKNEKGQTDRPRWYIWSTSIMPPSLPALPASSTFAMPLPASSASSTAE